MGAAAAVGAGVSLAAVHYLRSADVGMAAERAPPGEDPPAESDYWGSPVLPLEAVGGNKTMSPSKLPRPRKLFSDSEGEGMEVRGVRMAKMRGENVWQLWAQLLISWSSDIKCLAI